MHLVEVKTRSDFRRWRALTDEIYADAAGLYVPPIRQSLERMFRAARAPGATIGFYAVADDTGRFRARTTIHHDPAFDRIAGGRVQLFGFAEFVDDPEVTRCLFDAIRIAAREGGRNRILGPANLLPNEFGGVILSGFGERGFLDSAYNPDYYSRHYERAGFEQTYRSETLVCDLTPGCPDPAKVFAFDDRRLAEEGLAVRYCDRANLPEQIEMLRKLLNVCFVDRPYYTPITPDDMARRMKGLAHVMDEKLLAYLTRNHEPVGFAVFLPDVSGFLTAVGGDLGLVNQLRLLAVRRRHRRDAVGIVMGVTRAHRGRGYTTLLLREVFRNLIARGYRSVRTTYIEADNPAASAPFRKMGARVLHDLAFYEDSRPETWCDGVIAASEAAQRAPSAHNAQPWRLVCQDDRIALKYRPERCLPVSDPHARDLHLSLGAYAESLLIAAANMGVPATFLSDPDPQKNRVGWFLNADEVPRPEVDLHMLTGRRTNRMRFGPCVLDEPMLALLAEKLAGSGRLVAMQGDDISDLATRAERHFFASRGAVAEFRRWFRPGIFRRAAWDGLTASALGLSRSAAAVLWATTGPGIFPVLRRLGLPAVLGRSAAATLAPDTAVLALVAAAPSAEDRIDLGRGLQRIWLKLASWGLYVHPMSAILDCADTQAELCRRLSLAGGESVQCIFRVGPAARPSLSPRLPPAISLASPQGHRMRGGAS